VKETRTHNDANELTAVDPDGSGGAASLPLTHDKTGNVRERQLTTVGSNGWTKYLYTHDAWGRLVKVEHQSKPDGSSAGSPVVILQQEYNGLTRRTVKKADTSVSPNGLDQMTVMHYTAGWQLIEERIDYSWSSGFTQDATYHTIYGARYIDDVVCRRIDYTANGSMDATYYHLTDNQFSTLAILDETANLVERVDYDPYGRARHHHPIDVDGDGDYDAADSTAIDNAVYFHAGPINCDIGVAGYIADGDLNRDGVIDGDDQTIAGGTRPRAALALGVLSEVGNVFGFSGYVYNAETPGAGGNGGLGGGMYTVRFRHYDVGMGRWIERDPLGYVDGMSLYEYVGGMPLRALDPFGQSWNPFTYEYWYYFTEGWLETSVLI